MAYVLIPVPPEIAASALVRLSVPMVDEAAVVVLKVEVPVKLEVPVTPRFKTARREPSKVKFAESTTRPPVVANSARPDVSEEMASCVVVAFVVVALVELEFAKIVVPVNVGAAERTKLPVPVTPVTSVRMVSSCEMVVKAEERPRLEVAT